MKIRTSVQLESGSHDVRYVAKATLATGKELAWESDWKPSHWDLQMLRTGVVREARQSLKGLVDRYGLESSTIRLEREKRTVRRYVETHVVPEFDSEHLLLKGETP